MARVLPSAFRVPLARPPLSSRRRSRWRPSDSCCRDCLSSASFSSVRRFFRSWSASQWDGLAAAVGGSRPTTRNCLMTGVSPVGWGTRCSIRWSSSRSSWSPRRPRAHAQLRTFLGAPSCGSLVRAFVTDMVSVSMVWTLDLSQHTQFGVLNTRWRSWVCTAGMVGRQTVGPVRAGRAHRLGAGPDTYAIIILADSRRAKDLYEAAILDGANRWRCSEYHPAIGLAALFFVLIISMMSSFQVFRADVGDDQGGPEDSTISIVMYLYTQGFKFLNMGYASAIAWVLFLMIFNLTMVNWLMRKLWVYEG